MTVPEQVSQRLGEEPVRAHVSLGGDDELVVTPTRTLIYRGEGFLSGSSIEEYSHDAEAMTIKEGRRKSTIQLDHGIDGDSEFSLPSGSLDEALPPIIGGVLSAAGVLEESEAVEEVYRQGELTIVIAEKRVIKHVGETVWDEEFEEYHYERVTAIEIEEGSVSSQVIVETDGRPERIKAPSEDARAIREQIKRALLSYHGVGTYEAFRESVLEDETKESDTTSSEPEEPTAQTATEDDAEATEETTSPAESKTSAESNEPDVEESSASEPTADPETTGPSISSSPDTSTESTVEVESGDGSAAIPDEVAEELADLRKAVERQNEILEAHQRAIELLIEELRE